MREIHSLDFHPDTLLLPGIRDDGSHRLRDQEITLRAEAKMRRQLRGVREGQKDDALVKMMSLCEKSSDASFFLLLLWRELHVHAVCKQGVNLSACKQRLVSWRR